MHFVKLWGIIIIRNMISQILIPLLHKQILQNKPHYKWLASLNKEHVLQFHFEIETYTTYRVYKNISHSPSLLKSKKCLIICGRQNYIFINLEFRISEFNSSYWEDYHKRSYCKYLDTITFILIIQLLIYMYMY